MKITIINSERTEKTYTREELQEFIAQLSNGTFRQEYIRDIKKEVCFAAEWVKTNGELHAKTINPLVLLSLENLRDLPTVENKPAAAFRAATSFTTSAMVSKPSGKKASSRK